jgi:hypothetical protein
MEIRDSLCLKSKRKLISSERDCPRMEVLSCTEK